MALGCSELSSTQVSGARVKEWCFLGRSSTEYCTDCTVLTALASADCSAGIRVSVRFSVLAHDGKGGHPQPKTTPWETVGKNQDELGVVAHHPRT